MLSSDGRPTASIVLATRNNADLLRGALESIARDRSRVSRELIVVDNGSTDATAQVVAAVGAVTPFDLRVVDEPAPGHSRARNAGIAAARGAYLLFTDDDVLVHDGWCDALVAPFADPSVGVVAGRTVPLWPSEPPSWLDGPHRARLALYDFGDSDRALEPGEWPAGANMAFRGDVLRNRSEPFAVTVGNRGTRRFAADETFLVDELRAEHGIVYAAGAVVEHRIQPERMTPTWLRATYFDQGAAQLQIARLRGAEEPVPLVRRLVRMWRTCTAARRLRAAHDRAGRDGSRMSEELGAFVWAGWHVELALGRWPRLTVKVRDALA